MATTDTTDTTDTIDSAAMDRAHRRLQAWAGARPEAALLARYAALAVRVDGPLLRRLRLQLLPRAEPGIEADVWFAGLHESVGRSGFVFDTRVQQLLRAQLAAPVPAGMRWPLEQAWQITAGLHADWPEALRTEEALTFQALRGAPDGAAQIEALLAPALKAMAGGGEARALEVARWAQRAVPRLPGAARQHPSALALWLASLLRLGLSADQLPDTGSAGLPATLRWLLPAAQLSARQRVALTPFDDALRLQPLADDAAGAAQQILLPRTRPLLLALQVQDAAGAPLLQRTLALDAAAAETRLPLPLDWQALDLHSLAGERWRLQRQAGTAQVDEDLLPWQQARVQVLGLSGPSGMGTFVSPTEVVTVVDVLPPAQVQALRDGDVPVQASAAMPTVRLHAWDADGDRQELQARLVALDLRSALALMVLQRPFAGALVASRSNTVPMPGAAAWTVPGLEGKHGRWAGEVQVVEANIRPLAARPAPDALAQHFSVPLQKPAPAMQGMAGAPVFVDKLLAGIADLASAGEAGTSTLWAVPAPAIDRLLAWARQSEQDSPLLLLHHAVDDPYGKGAELDERAVQRIEQVARRARLRLVHAADASAPLDHQGSFHPGLAAAVRLVTPVTRENSSDEARLRLLALAARRWAQPDFGVLQLGFHRLVDTEHLPAPLAGQALQDLQKTDPEALARQLLELAESSARLASPSGPLLRATERALLQRLPDAARPFQPGASALEQASSAALAQDLRAVAERVQGRWHRSSRLDAVPLVELLAQLALPLQDGQLLDRLRQATRGALVLNAMPIQLARLLIARAHVGHAPPPCVVVRDQDWWGGRTVGSIHGQVVEALTSALGCRPEDAQLLLDRLRLAPWVLITTRPLPDRDTLQALQARLPSARLLFLAGAQPNLHETAHAIGAEALPPLPEGSDMQWLAGYRALMQWARPRQIPVRKRRATAKPLKK